MLAVWLSRVSELLNHSLLGGDYLTLKVSGDNGRAMTQQNLPATESPTMSAYNRVSRRDCSVITICFDEGCWGPKAIIRVQTDCEFPEI
jgi:hypothetical protein